LAETNATHKHTFELLSKQGQVITELAKQLLTSRIDDSILRVQDYATELDTSVGTIHSSLNYLQSIGATQLEGRGRLGTFVQSLDYPLLWSIAVGRPLVGAMPLPYTRRLEGLATGIRTQFDHPHINLDMRFVRGSTNRLQKLSSATIDYAIVSQFAADTAHVHGFDIDVVLTLDAGSYTSRHVLLLSDTNTHDIQDGMRVGIDMASADHARIVHTVCRGKSVEFIHIDYIQALQLLNSHQIDATVWTEEDLPVEFASLKVMALDKEKYGILKSLSVAVIVVQKNNAQIMSILKSLLDSAGLQNIQRDIIEFNKIPSY
jgi:hypothetical protein